ncbi:MAG: phosphate ABC transporter permease PstA [Pseudomonadota bacterium]
MTALSAHHGSDAAARRSRSRRNAQLRLQAYGLIAIGLAGAALVTLLWSVFSKTALVLTESYIALPVEVPGDIDPDNIRAANFNGIYRSALYTAFPQVSGRRDRRALTEIVSSAVLFELQERVEAEPALIGQTFTYPMLASDDVDLYLKGVFGRLSSEAHSGDLSMTVDGADIQLFSTANDFNAVLAFTKDALLDRAAFLRGQAALQDTGRRVTEGQAVELEAGEQRDALEARIAGYIAQRDRLLAEADDLDDRADAPGGTEAMGTDIPSLLIHVSGGWIRATEVSADRLRGRILVPPEGTETTGPENWKMYVNDRPEETRKVSDAQIAYIEDLRKRGAISTVFNWRFLTSSDSREAELAGIWGAAVGSFWTMLVTFCLAFPIGVLSAIYLEEFAPKNRFTDFIEVNINNLAAVPSIVFGLLGLAVFLNFFGVPRSAPLAGGIVLALMTLPTIIIASRAAIKAVPPSIRDAALGVGASKLQTSFHHVIPLAMPGILTGTIIGMAQALGETAPLIMIGMVAFIVDVPGGVTDPATALPVQVFRWSDFPERAFEAKTSAAICVLLLFLVIMNALAIFLRRRFERRW